MECKIVVLGAGAVGKSALTVVFCRNYFIKDYDPTIEDAYRRLVIVDNTAVVAEIIDTAGQEEYSALRDQYFRSGEGFVLVYSVTDEHSLEVLPSLATRIRRAKDQDTIPLVLVGNKIDLDGQRVISTEKGKSFAKSMDAQFLETSAKSKTNVEAVFATIIREIWKKTPKRKPSKRSCDIL